MNWTRRLQVLVAVSVALFCVTARAAEPDVTRQIDELQKGQETLRTELAQVNITLQAILAELQRAKPEGAVTGPTLAEIDGQLKKITTQLAYVTKAVDASQRKKREADTKAHDINVGSSAVLGPKDARVTIVEFADLQCPYCIREYPKIKEVLKAYPKDVRLVFKHFPLQMHATAKPIHAALELAHKQLGDDGFWQMHDLIVAADRKTIISASDPKDPNTFDYSTLRGLAKEVGIDTAKFDEVVADQAQWGAIFTADMAEAQKCGVRGTPTVLINGLKLTDRSIEGYKARIDEILKGKGLPKIKVIPRQQP